MSCQQKLFSIEDTNLGKTIAVANQKGGVGKTTTAINLASCLSEKGKKVLLVDMDPQGNTTSGYGIEKEEVEYSIYDVIMGEGSIDEAIMHLEYPDPEIGIIPSVTDLAGAEVELMDMENREYRLKDQLDPIKEDYDFIFIDCPPSLSLITINCFAAADSILIPMQAEYYAMEGLALLINTIEMIKQGMNPSLDIEGIVFTMYDGRTKLSQEIVDSVTNSLNVRIFKTFIPRNVRLAEAPSYGMPINLYDKKSKGAKSYRKLAEELLEPED